MPSKLQHEFDKLRGKIAVTGKVYKDTMSDLETQISTARSTIVAVETNLKAAIRQNKAKARSESSHAANSSLPASGGKMTGELDMDRHDLIGVSDLECGDTGGIGFYSTAHALTATLDNSGNFTPQGTTDGRDLVTDGNKLDLIEDNADVTDATNVNASGAVMRSDFESVNGIQCTQGTAGSPQSVGIPAQKILGRLATGNVKALSIAEVQSLINVEDGATADQSDAEIKTAVENATSIQVGVVSLYTNGLTNANGTGDTYGVNMNYEGYNYGTSYFRRFNIYDGKQGLICQFEGSSKAVTFHGDIVTAHNVDGRDIAADGIKLDSAVMTLYGFIAGSESIPASTIIGSLPAHAWVIGTFCQTIATWNGTDTAGYIGFTGDLDAYGTSTSLLGATGIVDLPAGTELGYSTSTREVRIGVNGTNVTQGNVVMGIRYMILEP